MSELYDLNQRKMEIGDILKVFHFTDADGKDFYIYKQIIGRIFLGKGEYRSEYFKISHLDMTGDYYTLPINNKILTDYEIIQTLKWERLD